MQLDREIVISQREKQGGDLRFTEHFTEGMTLRIVGAELAPGPNSRLLACIFEYVRLAASSFMIHLGPQLSSYHSGQTDRIA